jgi:histone H3/H4
VAQFVSKSYYNLIFTMAKQKQVAKTSTKKNVSKKTAKPVAKKPISKAKAATKRATPKAVKKPVTQKELGLKVREVVHGVNPKINLTEDAVELLNAILMEKFTQIAETAAQIVNKAKQENLDCEDVKKAVNKVFKQKLAH